MSSLLPHVAFGLLTTAFIRLSNRVLQKLIPRWKIFPIIPLSLHYPPSTSPAPPVTPTLSMVQTACHENPVLFQFRPGHASPGIPSIPLGLSPCPGQPGCLHRLQTFSVSELESTTESFLLPLIVKVPSSFWSGTWKSKRKSASVSWTPLKYLLKSPCKTRPIPVPNQKQSLPDATQWLPSLCSLVPHFDRTLFCIVPFVTETRALHLRATNSGKARAD